MINPLDILIHQAHRNRTRERRGIHPRIPVPPPPHKATGAGVAVRPKHGKRAWTAKERRDCRLSTRASRRRRDRQQAGS